MVAIFVDLVWPEIFGLTEDVSRVVYKLKKSIVFNIELFSSQ